MVKSQVVRAFSAGGVVFRPSRAISSRPPRPSALPETPAGVPPGQSALRGVEIALVGYPREQIWVLPKGTPSLGETPEQTAAREVREETGLSVRVLGDLGSIEYWFARKSVRFHKEVALYLMLAVGGDVSQHDHEYDEARWFPYSEAVRQLTHTNEAAAVRHAEPFIRRWLADQQASAEE